MYDPNVDQAVISERDAVLSDLEQSDNVPPSLLESETLYRTLRSWFELDAAHSGEWRTNAREDYDFAAGDQWEEDVRRELEAQGRPCITFNRVLSVIKAVAGIEINGRHETIYIPRDTGEGDVKINEILSQASQWMGDGCDAEDEQSEAFQDALICGMGWCLSDDAMVRLPNTHFATTRLYTGDVIEIDLENGKKLTGTPNHPVLTDRGWKRLSAIDEGDNLVTSAFLERVNGFPIEQFDHVETRLKDKIDSFRATREVSRFVTAPNDFYGDGIGSDIHVVYADSLLSRKFRDAARHQGIHQLNLAGRDILAKLRVFFLRYGMLLHPACAAERQSSLGFAHSPSSQLSGILGAAHDDTGSAKALADSLTLYTKLFANLIGRESFSQIEMLDLFKSSLGFGATRMTAQGKSSTLDPSGNGTSGYSEFVSDFRDWKSILEIQSRHFFGGNSAPSEFITRVRNRVVKFVREFPVHDVGTSLGMFVAGDIITSNSESVIDHELDPDGKYIERRVDPLEMYWDKDARAKNLIDGRRIWRVRRMSLDDARSFVQGLGVNVPDSELNAAWAASAGFGDTEDPQPVEDRRFRDENVELPFDPRSEVYIVQAQWWERERYWRVADFGGNQTSDLSEDEFMTLKSRAQMLGIDVIAAPMTRRVYKQAFLGASILGPVRDCPAGDRFNFTCITGEKHRNKGYWFGLTRIMRDPQLWANKWLSQTLHILNSTAKGGIIAELDAFDDQRQAEASYAAADQITWAARDSIQKGKIMQKPGVAMSTAHYVNLLQFAISSIRDVTGINLELLGMRDANQPGILEAQRKQAALTILATLFDSLRRFRKEVGRIRLHYIQNYLSDGRLIRISGGDNFQLIPLIRDNTIGNYDVIVDDAPTSPNQKEQTWGILMQMLPMFRDMMTPEIAMMILEYSPLPSKFVESLKQIASEPNPEAELQKQLVMEKGKAEIIDLQSRAKKTMAGAGLDEAKTASERVNAVLDIAKAASEMSQAKLDQAQAEAVEADTARQEELSRLPPPDFENPFLVGPDLSGPQLPSLAPLPVSRGGNNQLMPMGLATQGGIVPEAEPELLAPPFANVYEGR